MLMKFSEDLASACEYLSLYTAQVLTRRLCHMRKYLLTGVCTTASDTAEQTRQLCTALPLSSTVIL